MIHRVMLSLVALILLGAIALAVIRPAVPFHREAERRIVVVHRRFAPTIHGYRIHVTRD